MRRKRKRWSDERRAALSAKIQEKIAAGWRPFKKSSAIVHIVAKPVPTEEPAKILMEVMQIPLNTRIVIAKDTAGKRQSVVVGNNATFVYGDKIEVKPHATEKSVWSLIGRPPRYKRRP